MPTTHGPLPVSPASPAWDEPAEQARWRLRLLGGFALKDGRVSTVHRLPSRAITLLLARLAIEPGRAHGREELIDLLWPEVDLGIGRNRLRQGLSVLRAVLEPCGEAANSVLQADRRTLQLVPGALDCDVDAFLRALRQGDNLAAAQIYRGELLPGFFDEWVLEARRHLAGLAETLAGGLMAPSPKAPQALRTAAPPTSAPTRLRLPTYLTCMLGFDEARASLAAALKSHRLVLLRGPGGAGKTRLAVEVARAIGEVLPGPGPAEPGFDLVAFVPLAACLTREALHDAVWLALRQEAAAAPSGEGAARGDDLLQRLEQTLAGRRVLLVLDNFEQLVEAGRDDLSRWLARLPWLHLLVTSRRALGLDGEVEQLLSALPLPALDDTLQAHALNPSVALFVDRARSSRSDFHLGERNHERVAAIVRELQGLPLAIELAAARVRSLSLGDLLAMLQGAARQAPGRALTLLTRSGPRAADDARHASMLRVVNWSWQLLPAPAQSLLGALSVFDGGCTLAAAASMLQRAPADAATGLDELVAASVAYFREGPDERCRYHPFEPVREFTLMQLGPAEVARLRSAHATWVGQWAASLGAAPALEAFRDELPNLLAALAQHTEQGTSTAALRLLADVAYALDDVNLPPAALGLVQRALDDALNADPPHPAEQQGLAAEVQAIMASQCFEAGQRSAAIRHAEQALAALPPEGVARPRVLRAAARVLLRTHGDAADVAPLLDEALAWAKRLGEHDLEARTLTLQAVLLAQREHDWEGSLALKRQALALWQRHGPPARVAEGQVNLALGLGFGRAMPEKLALLERALESAEARGQTRLLAFIHSVHGYALADLRCWDEAGLCFAACLRTAWDAATWREWFYGLWNLPRTLAHRRRPEPAALLMGFAEAFYQGRFGHFGWSDQREARRTRRLVRVQLGVAREEALWCQGQGLGMAQAMRLALQEAGPLASPDRAP
jgi:predicted ATPase